MKITFKIPDQNFFGTGVRFKNPYSAVAMGTITFSYSSGCDATV